ncbi:polyamine aminopropyltransferase [Tistrella mobilis]
MEKIIAAADSELWFTERMAGTGFQYSLQIAEVLHAERTPFQRLEVFRTTGFGTAMVLDGFVNVSDKDEFFYHEVMAHPALFIHERPRRVLIIGGGDCGVLREVLRHPAIDHVDMVEIDERVVRVSEKFFPELTASNNDPRASIRFEDGVAWVRNAAPGSYDVIIVDSTDPVGPAEGLFGAAFYADCHRILTDGGMVVVQSESPLFHQGRLKEIHRCLRGAGFVDSHPMTYPTVIYGGGTWSSSIARKGRQLNDGVRWDDIETRPFPTRYYNRGVHVSLMTLSGYLAPVLDGL